ncbi:hypothetical protein NS274_05070 [Pseudomonas oryzihabitans]|nr:hypothetical protein NS274_05070 [Pseudomonas psychrotolerans]KTT39617.1 hypothetical protein SB5_10665 [Pseudomonas psychrotolerans]KTT43904.1 hypothetical protein RSA46_14565 [Pseudomonas psychrotolerans]KTT65942.1 hypothetical protein NS383_08840 [Pseudomonas psychrotolerans]
MRSLLCCLLLVTTGTAMAQDVFKCVDAQGQTTYTLGACPAGSQVTVIPLQSSANGFTPATPAANPPPAAVAPQQQNIIIIPPAPRPADGITIVGGSSSSSSSSAYSTSHHQGITTQGPRVIYQPYPVYIERPRHETWHMVPHPQAMQPPPPPPSPGIPIDR